MLGFIRIAVCTFLLAPAIALAQVSDTTPPELVEFDFNPKNLDVTAAPQLVTVTARITDDLSGAESFFVYFTSPSGSQSHFSFIGRTGGSPLDGTYSGSVEIPQFVESGIWSASISSLRDSVGNTVSLDSANLASLGFPTDLNVDSVPDTTPPSIVSADFAPPAIDVSGGDQVITLRLSLTDDISGVDVDRFYFFASIDSPGFQQQYIIPTPVLIPVPGMPDTWDLPWTIPQHSAGGTWSLGLTIADNAGNFLFAPGAGSFDVISTVEDLIPPQLTGLSFSPVVIDTSAGPASVTVELDLTDNLTGVDLSLAAPGGGYFHGLQFESPSNNQRRSACCGQFSIISGDVLNGRWQAEILFPQFSEAGTWKAIVSNVTDRVRNGLSMTSAELEAALFPVDLVVVRPSLAGDGVVDAGGGTVVDDTFGDRAAITFPPGTVTEDTDVAIDVFPDPLAIPNPVGFQGPGSFFMNISLTPEPSYPVPAPGLTVTLPLPDFLNPGTTIPLFFVDNVAGTLEPMPDITTGDQVVGLVNADGLSAIFTGIPHLTILVGLLPDGLTCDVDNDGDITRADISSILRARGQPATGPDDPMDADGDGAITRFDVTLCARQLSR
jgi:hypothetical protein